MVTDQQRTTDKLLEHGTLSGRIMQRRPEQNGLQISAEDGKRRPTCWAFHAHAATTGNDRSPRVERGVDGTSSVFRLGRSEVLTCTKLTDWTSGLSNKTGYRYSEFDNDRL